MLKRAYDWCVSYASHPAAPWLLFGLTFIESSFSPLPPIPLLIPMCIARPDRAWLYAGICSLGAVLGGYLGYAIGALLYESVGAWLIGIYGLQDKAASLIATSQDYWFWVLVTKGLTPIPFKIVTIRGGQAMHPAELVGVFFGVRRVAVRQVDRGDADHAVTERQHAFQIARLLVALVARQAAPHILQRRAAEDRDAVEGLLPMRLHLPAGGLDLGAREIGIDALDLLQAERVGLGLFQEVEEMAEALPDRIDVPGGDPHAMLRFRLPAG